MSEGEARNESEVVGRRRGGGEMCVTVYVPLNGSSDWFR